MNLRSLVIRVLICAALISCSAYACSYQSVRIVDPEPKKTAHDNSGNLAVVIAVSPPLRREGGDNFALLFDVKVVASGVALKYKLTAIGRGSHTLQVRLKAHDGSILATLPPVEFN